MYTVNGQKNFSRALKWGIVCFCISYTFGDIVKNKKKNVHIWVFLILWKLSSLLCTLGLIKIDTVGFSVFKFST